MKSIALCLVACLAVLPHADGQLAAAEQPNIILIVGDDMGYADLGVHGCQDIPTPHIDALAASGVRFTNGYVSGPYCSPTRAGLLTGRYQTRFGHEFNCGGREGSDTGLPLSEKTLADRLKAAGYHTAMVGKWHLGNGDKFHPLSRGFDEFFGFLGGAHSYFPGDGAPILRGRASVDEQAYLTDAFTREAVEFINRQKDGNKPFFMYLTYNAVHTPMHADDPRLEKFAAIKDKKRRTYVAMMSAMDDGVGAVMKKLQETGLAENTLVAFISDNGGPTMRGVTVNGADNAPLRGSKRTTLEGGVRVPFFVAWPGRISPGQVYELPVIQLDLFSTAIAAAGVAPQEDWNVEGVDLTPHLSGAKTEPPHDALYWRFGQQMAIRKGDWKLVAYDPAVEGGKGKATPQKLYNLAEDIGEERNLIAEHPEKARELQAAWDEWNKQNVPPKWGGRSGKRTARRARAG
ncbi:MAG TPA: sulfatase [Lacipirellula sp.]